MTFVLSTKKRPPKEVKLHQIQLQLKGYALEYPLDCTKEGYFYSHKKSLHIFDPKFNVSRELRINYRESGDDYFTLWGFRFVPGERILRCGLDSLILIQDHGGQRYFIDIVANPPQRREYETRFFSAVAESLTQKVGEVNNTSPLDPKSHFGGIKPLQFYPKEFQDAFRIAIRESKAFSIPKVYVTVCLEQLGVRPGRETRNSTYTPIDICRGALHPRPGRG